MRTLVQRDERIETLAAVSAARRANTLRLVFRQIFKLTQHRMEARDCEDEIA
jgi:hypothetical protein